MIFSNQAGIKTNEDVLDFEEFMTSFKSKVYFLKINIS